MEVKRRTQADRTAATRAQLLTAARGLFATRGYAAVGTPEIAAAAGVTRGALYHQFADKAELFGEVVEVVEAEVTQRLVADVAAAAPVGPLATLHAAIDAWLVACARAEVRQVLLVDGPAVLGWAAFRDLARRHGLGLTEQLVGAAVDVPGVEVGPARPRPARRPAGGRLPQRRRPGGRRFCRAGGPRDRRRAGRRLRSVTSGALVRCSSMRAPRSRLGVLLAAAGLGLAAAPAHAAETDLGPIAAPTQMAAEGGWVAFSEQAPDGRWSLVAVHEGIRATLPVAPRPQPFDVDLGRDERGRVVATYSRCATEPGQDAVDITGLAAFVDGGARSCSLRELRLGAGEDSVLRVPRRRGDVDVTPSRAGRFVAYARHRGDERVAQVVRYDTRTRREQVLPHGTMPKLSAGENAGEVQALDLSPRAVGYLWRVGPNVPFGTGTVWELRAVTLRARTRTLAAAGYVSGACGSAVPRAPNVDDRELTYLETGYDCEVDSGSVASVPLAGGIPRRAPQASDHVVVALARDGATDYEVREPGRGGRGSAPCADPMHPCRLVRSTPLPARTEPVSRRPPATYVNG